MPAMKLRLGFRLGVVGLATAVTALVWVTSYSWSPPPCFRTRRVVFVVFPGNAYLEVWPQGTPATGGTRQMTFVGPVTMSMTANGIAFAGPGSAFSLPSIRRPAPGCVSFRLPFYVPLLGFVLALAYLMALPSLLRRRRRRSGLCVQCGYDLRGLTTPRCPECGEGFQEP